MAVSKSSKPSRISKKQRGTEGVYSPLPVTVTGLALAALSALAVTWFYSCGYLLDFGDAVAHLNIARHIIDSRTPGYEQFGTVWLPLPHALMLPFVGNNFLWRSGLAGAIPSALCFVLAGMFLFAAARRLLGAPAAVTVAAIFALNPNVLYMQSIAMTEVPFMAAIAALLYFTVRFRDTQSPGAVLGAGLASAAASLTRYEGWFLIPFVALYFLLAARRRRVQYAVLFSAIAGLAPLYWMAHNWWYYGSFLEFFNGPYSAKAIYQRQLAGGMSRYAGDGDWPKAWLYFRTAVRLCSGLPLFWMGAAGIAVALWRRAFWPVLLLLLPGLFYVWSIHSSSTPIYVPELWPSSYYNTRYGLVLFPALALCAGALVCLAPSGIRKFFATAVICAAVSPWLLYPRQDNWVCWKESEVNSEARRAWTRAAADFLRANYHAGDGIFTSLGDLSPVFTAAGIPLRETLNEGNHPQWDAAIARPDLFLHEGWALSISGGSVSTALLKTRRRGPHYECVKIIAVPGGPVVEVYRRQ